MELRKVVFTLGPLVDVLVVVEETVELADVDLLFACAADEETVVVGVMEGLYPGACWMSFPCSVMSAGPSSWRFLRSCGSSFDRINALMGCFEDDSSLIVISNCWMTERSVSQRSLEKGWTARERTTYSSSSVS